MSTCCCACCVAVVLCLMHPLLSSAVVDVLCLLWTQAQQLHSKHQGLFPAVPCCAVLCFAVLCCVVQCCLDFLLLPCAVLCLQCFSLSSATWSCCCCCCLLQAATVLNPLMGVDYHNDHGATAVPETGEVHWLGLGQAEPCWSVLQAVKPVTDMLQAQQWT